MSGGLGVDAWWSSLGSAALVGTARREVPRAPDVLSTRVVERAGATSSEVSLLDALAVGTALRRAGRTGRHVPDHEREAGAEPDRLPLAPATARQLLDLLLTQSPVGPRLTPLALGVWLREAARAGVRVHHASLVPLLTAATAAPELREAVVPVLDSRGSWLSSRNPVWSWVHAASPESEAVAAGDWASAPTERRAALLRSLRRTDPARARDLLDATWATDPAAARAELLATLEAGLSLDDEPLLERALDDRAAGVREVAHRLLDQLPGSARATRLAGVLGGLLSTSGVVRKKVHLELPQEPDAAAVRDGLGPAPKGRSQRGLWMERIAAGAPLETWTEVTGVDPAGVVRSLEDPDALRGLRSAVLGRRDADWARALLDVGWDGALMGLLPPDDAARRVLDRLEQVTTLHELAATLRLLPAPWSAEASARVVKRLTKLDPSAPGTADLVTVLALGLHPTAAPAVQRLAASSEGGRLTPLQHLVQYLSLVPTITEAFR